MDESRRATESDSESRDSAQLPFQTPLILDVLSRFADNRSLNIGTVTLPRAILPVSNTNDGHCWPAG